MGIRRIFQGYMLVNRKEYFPAAITTIGIPAILAVRSFTEISSNGWILLGVLGVWYLSHFIGARINCLSDYEIDRQHPIKDVFPKAIDRLGGKRRLYYLAFIEGGLALTLSILIASIVGRPILPILWAVGVFFALAYSLKPFRLKGRGVLNPTTLTIIIQFMPSFFTYLALVETASFTEVGILLLWAAQYSSMFFSDEIGDYPEDKSVGIGTPAVRWGVKRTSLIALLIFSSMSPMVLFATYLVFGLSTTLLISLPFFLSYLYVARDLRKLHLLARMYEKAPGEEAKDIMVKIRIMGKKTPMWIVIIGIPILAVKIIDLALLGV